MKVWILVDEHCGDCGQIQDVFASEAMAWDARDRKKWPDKYRVEEWEVTPA